VLNWNEDLFRNICGSCILLKHDICAWEQVLETHIINGVQNLFLKCHENYLVIYIIQYLPSFDIPTNNQGYKSKRLVHVYDILFHIVHL